MVQTRKQANQAQSNAAQTDAQDQENTPIHSGSQSRARETGSDAGQGGRDVLEGVAASRAAEGHGPSVSMDLVDNTTDTEAPVDDYDDGASHDDGVVAPEDDDSEGAVSGPGESNKRTTKHAGRSLGAGSWKAWEDRALAQEVLALELWKLGQQSRGVLARWDQLAQEINKKNPMFSRAGTACKARFHRLLLHEKVRAFCHSNFDVGS